MSGHISLVVVNGDSNAAGAELERPNETCFGAVVARHLGADLANIAAWGGSNHRMWRTTVEHLPQVMARHGATPQNTLFLGMWSLPDRTEAGHDDPHPAVVPYRPFRDRNWHVVGSWQIDRRHRPSVAWFRELHEERGGVPELLLFTVLLEAWLESLGVRFGLALAYDVLPPDWETAFAGYRGQMSDHHYVGGIRSMSARSFRSLVLPLGDRGPRGHPLVDSHTAYARDHLMPWLKESGIE